MSPDLACKFVHFSDSRPQNLPSVPDIIAECMAARCRAASDGAATYLRGIRLANGSAFVKFGGGIKFREAEIQNFVYEFLSTSSRGHVRVARVYTFIMTAHYRFIVMEFIDGSTCNESHVDQVARALEELIAIQAPVTTTAPGPVSPGPIDHHFFEDYVSSVTYPTVEDLQLHLNRILKKQGYKDTLNLVSEVEQYGLRLCPSDMHETNFMVDSNGMIVAIDFGGTSFLPTCFFHYAIIMSCSFNCLLASKVVYPKYPTPEKSHVDALDKARYLLIIGSNNYALPKHLRPNSQIAGSGKPPTTC